MTTTTPERLPESLRVLLRRVVDYAGLFPPASLKMDAAVREFADHRGDADEWLLGRFVLPAARLDEFEHAAAPLLPRDSAGSWALSALGTTDLEEDVERIERFNNRHADVRLGAVLVDTVEIKTSSKGDVMHAAEILDRRFDTYMEVPVASDPAELIAAIGETRAKAKIRMGGVTADAFPPAAQVVRFMARCIAHNVAFKATAGLHHPFRAEYRLTYASDAAMGTMFGFFNALLAVAALHAGLGDGDAAALLEERDRAAIDFRDDGVHWTSRRVVLPMDALRRARDSMTAFGSCSFREPVSDLRAASLL